MLRLPVELIMEVLNQLERDEVWSDTWASLALCSKDFHRLTLPYLYSRIDGEQLVHESFVRAIRQKRGYGSFVKRLEWVITIQGFYDSNLPKVSPALHEAEISKVSSLIPYLPQVSDLVIRVLLTDEGYPDQPHPHDLVDGAEHLDILPPSGLLSKAAMPQLLNFEYIGEDSLAGQYAFGPSTERQPLQAFAWLFELDHLQRISLKAIDFSLLRLSTPCLTLRSMNITSPPTSGPDEQGIQRLLRFCPNLIELSLNMIEKTLDFEPLSSILPLDQPLLSLTTLALFDVSPHAQRAWPLYSLCPNLTDLSLHFCHGRLDTLMTSLFPVAKCCPDLKSLAIHTDSFYPDIAVNVNGPNRLVTPLLDVLQIFTRQTFFPSLRQLSFACSPGPLARFVSALGTRLSDNTIIYLNKERNKCYDWLIQDFKTLAAVAQPSLQLAYDCKMKEGCHWSELLGLRACNGEEVVARWAKST